jgi:hypothetical protein
MKNRKSNRFDIGRSLLYEQVKVLKDKFDTLIASEQRLVIYSDNIAEIDLTGIQLIQYFMIQAEMAGKELSFSINIADEPKSILSKNGFSHLLVNVLS